MNDPYDRHNHFNDYTDMAKRKRMLTRRNRNRDLRCRKWLHYQKNRPCFDCGELLNPWQMDFDHRPGEKKKFTIGTGDQRSWKTLKEEIRKCDVVCANCHRHRTYLRRNPEAISRSATTIRL